MKKILYLFVLTLTVTSCAFFNKSPLDIEGQRVSVIRENKNLQTDYPIGSVKIKLPKSKMNLEWNQTGGNASHYLGHLKAGGNLDEIWQLSYGKGSSKRNVLIANPVSDGVKIYTLDALGLLQASNLSDGDEIWSKELEHENKQNNNSSIIGAGLAVYDHKVFATTGFGKVFAMNAENGETLWEKDIKSPIRIAPCVDGELVIVQTLDNAIYALKINDGSVLWKDKIETENTIMLGGAAPAYSTKDDLVVAAFSNGQIQAYKASTGTPLWSEWVISGDATESISNITSIKANPIISDGVAYVVGYSGPLVAIDIRSGVKIWSRNINASSQPWLAGKLLFVLTNDGDLVALNKEDGKIFWSTIIPNENSQINEKYFVSGPILANDALLVVSSNGKLFSVSPYNGRIMGIADVEEDIETSPIMVNETLLLGNSSAELTAYK